MSDRLIEVLGTEISLTTASTVGGAHVVRLYHSGGSDTLATIKDSNGTTIGTVTIKAGEITFIKKRATDTIATATATLAVSVGFGD